MARGDRHRYNLMSQSSLTTEMAELSLNSFIEFIIAPSLVIDKSSFSASLSLTQQAPTFQNL
jgi:hypothetical protein